MASRLGRLQIDSSLNERRAKLDKALKNISNDQNIRMTLSRPESMQDGEQRITITGKVRIRDTKLYFYVWEDFRDFYSTPILYAFQYSLQPDAIAESDSIFRYECHPGIEDDLPRIPERLKGEEYVPSQNPFGSGPHFHPHAGYHLPISDLHYPFHRGERRAIVFTLVAWIKRDLLERFYDSGKVKKA